MSLGYDSWLKFKNALAGLAKVDRVQAAMYNQFAAENTNKSAPFELTSFRDMRPQDSSLGSLVGSLADAASPPQTPSSLGSLPGKSKSAPQPKEDLPKTIADVDDRDRETPITSEVNEEEEVSKIVIDRESYLKSIGYAAADVAHNKNDFSGSITKQRLEIKFRGKKGLMDFNTNIIEFGSVKYPATKGFMFMLFFEGQKRYLKDDGSLVDAVKIQPNDIRNFVKLSATYPIRVTAQIPGGYLDLAAKIAKTDNYLKQKLVMFATGTRYMLWNGNAIPAKQYKEVLDMPVLQPGDHVKGAGASRSTISRGSTSRGRFRPHGGRARAQLLEASIRAGNDSEAVKKELKQLIRKIL